MGYKKKCEECKGVNVRMVISGKALDNVEDYQIQIAAAKRTSKKNISKSMVINALLRALPPLEIKSIDNGCLISVKR